MKVHRTKVNSHLIVERKFFFPFESTVGEYHTTYRISNSETFFHTSSLKSTSLKSASTTKKTIKGQAIRVTINTITD